MLIAPRSSALLQEGLHQGAPSAALPIVLLSLTRPSTGSLYTAGTLYTPSSALQPPLSPALSGGLRRAPPGQPEQSSQRGPSSHDGCSLCCSPARANHLHPPCSSRSLGQVSTPSGLVPLLLAPPPVSQPLASAELPAPGQVLPRTCGSLDTRALYRWCTHGARTKPQSRLHRHSRLHHRRRAPKHATRAPSKGTLRPRRRAGHAVLPAGWSARAVGGPAHARRARLGGVSVRSVRDGTRCAERAGVIGALRVGPGGAPSSAASSSSSSPPQLALLVMQPCGGEEEAAAGGVLPLPVADPSLPPSSSGGLMLFYELGVPGEGEAEAEAEAGEEAEAVGGESTASPEELEEEEATAAAAAASSGETASAAVGGSGCKSCTYQGCSETTTQVVKQRKPWMCKRHRNKIYKDKYKRKKSDQALGGGGAAAAGTGPRAEDSVEGSISVTKQRTGSIGDRPARPTLLEQVLNKKRLSLLRSPEVVQFLQKQQQLLSQQALEQRQQQFQGAPG
ncbi:regulatory factor X-associated protein [Lathamus discolor]|uniref:regulatory factor X-associated protein n=1 Tax=Lathamus discolor TaxID=678569 RepID=UPI0032B78732